MEARPTRQLTLFDQAAPPPRDPHIADDDVGRVRGQNAIILGMLQRGACTNAELAAISLKYTSRISDLRAAGYRIACERMGNGLTRYTLEL